MKDSIDFINFFKLSIQRALLGNITHNVRAIIAELRQNDIQLFFYYDGEIQESDKETASEIESEIIADFDDNCNIDLNIRRLDYPKLINHVNGICVYLRKES
ncbi:hypothetical protein QVN83_02675 [Yersinia frederiksenii]|uniref:hypothetical protein n=1 Tax=Yersinia frederiksenii TaxID=29484 RepID=UPI0025AA93F8|nr:hypothetical protein [Yersinia frederiksenii]MDN0117881.1 hypothetical protein [Yersinia frederiksenii]